MRIAGAFFAVAVTIIIAAWAWLGMPVQMPPFPNAAGQKLDCVSYAPFRGDQTPFGPDVPVDPRQIDADLAQLKEITDCVRTYSVDHGVDQIPEIARRNGMKVMQGVWVSNMPEQTAKQVATAVGLARHFPDVIQSVIVGNEVLLRGEMSAADLSRTIREVKAQVSVPVTYGDVWEFWLRYPEVAGAVDFITVHILPYWEDFPIPVSNAAAHIDAIRRRVASAFPGKEIFIGEFGWPSAGRMREGALPSPVNQARALVEAVGLARREHYRLNVIEAYDQPWKRQLEGTVGGHWGLFDAYRRQPKFAWGGLVSNHPGWWWQGATGVGLAVLVFGAAAIGSSLRMAPATGLRVAANAVVSGVFIGWVIEKIPIESLTAGDWLRSFSWVAVAALAPIAAAAALTRKTPVPTFARVLGRRGQRAKEPLGLITGALLVAITILALQAALGLVFDPRYRDFPFAALSGAVLPFLVMMRSLPRLRRIRLGAESVAAAALALSATYILFNETLANWQAVWFCAGLWVLALVLLSVQDAPEAHRSMG
jgi:exo-beta-1,3-glucanase (GH17 family)